MQPLDEKDLEKKLKKEQKVLALIWFCAVYDGVGEYSSRIVSCVSSFTHMSYICVLSQAKVKEDKKLKAKQKEAARLQVATGDANSFLDLEERFCLTDVIVCRSKQHLMELRRVRRSKRRKAPPMRIPRISLIRILPLDRRNCLLLKWPNSTARPLLRNRMLPFSL